MQRTGPKTQAKELELKETTKTSEKPVNRSNKKTTIEKSGLLNGAIKPHTLRPTSPERIRHSEGKHGKLAKERLIAYQPPLKKQLKTYSKKTS